MVITTGRLDSGEEGAGKFKVVCEQGIGMRRSANNEGGRMA
jgi:hypothetical protein